MQGFYFALLQYSPIKAFTVVFLLLMQIIPPEHQNRLQGFTGAFPLICHISARTIQKTHKLPIHRLRHVGGHTVKCSPFTDTRYHRHAGRCTGQRSRPILIRYIRVRLCALLWIHARQCSTPQTMPARRGSPAIRARRAARNH